MIRENIKWSYKILEVKVERENNEGEGENGTW